MFYAILLVSSTLVQAVPNTTAISFLLMVASGSSPDFSTLVPAVDHDTGRDQHGIQLSNEL